MRLYLVLALAVLVLPLSGCAKKKQDDSASTANNSEPADTSADSEGMDDSMDEGMGEEHGDESAMNDETGIDGDMMSEDFTEGGHGEEGMPEGDPVADASESQNREFFEGNESVEAPGEARHSEEGMPEAGHSEDGMPEGAHGENPQGKKKSAPADMPEGDEGMPDMPESDPLEGDAAEGTMPEGDMPSENPEGIDGMGEGGGVASGSLPTKPTDVQGVKEDTAEYAAVDLLIKIGRGETEGLKSLIAEDTEGLLKNLRDNPEKALPEAKETVGLWKPQSTRLENRDTVVTFLNNKGKALRFYVRKIQGTYVVRELRVLDAVDKTPRRRR